MKYDFFIMILLSLTMGLVVSCSDDEKEEILGNWVERSDFDGVPRCDAVGFSIGDKGYVGTGYDGEFRLSDFWEFNPATNAWTQKADFPGLPRNGAVGFGTATKGYVGTGYSGYDRLKDFWEYDPALNTWTAKADFEGSPRYGAVGFSIDNIGYIGTGYDGTYLKDFWAYDPGTDTWEQEVSIGGSKRKDAAGFVIGNKGYICTGVDNGSYQTDLFEYDPTSGLWTEKRSIADVTKESFDNKYKYIIGTNKVAFSINGKGYLTTGGAGYSGVITYEYDPVKDLWTSKNDFEGTDRLEAVGFAIGNRGYVTTGKNSSYYFDDIWAFDPFEKFDQYD